MTIEQRLDKPEQQNQHMERKNKRLTAALAAAGLDAAPPGQLAP